MTSAVTDLPLAVSILTPPYLHVPPPAGRTGPPMPDLARGAVLALHVRDPLQDLPLLHGCAPVLRRAIPGAPLALCLPEEPGADALPLLLRASEAGVRAVLVRGRCPREALRRALSHPVDLPRDVAEWVALRVPRVGPVVLHLIQQIFTEAPRYSAVADLLRNAGVAETSARARMRKKHLPAPGRWLNAARALRIAMRIQSEEERSLLEIAFDLGYADHSAISQAIRRSFHLRPKQIRGTLGWEWLLERWLLPRPAQAVLAAA